jgi:hypothetical protein
MSAGIVTIVQDSVAMALYGRKYASLTEAQRAEVDRRMGGTSGKFRKELEGRSA